jgi:hypothetical protein
MKTRTSGSRWVLPAVALAVLGLTASWVRVMAGGPGGFRIQRLAAIGDPLPGPGGGTFVNDFEPGGINGQGEIAFGADVSTGGEGIFLLRRGRIRELARSGGDAPGGGTYEFGFLGPVALNDPGDVVYDFLLSPFSLPVGTNAGVYHYSHTNGRLTPVLIPYVTPAPGGGVFQGTGFEPSINNRGDIVFVGLIETDDGIHVPGETYIGLGAGLFRADARGRISSMVSPGDPAPGGGTFDYAVDPWLSEPGDLAFLGHIAGEDSVIEGFPPQDVQITALTSLYLRESGGTIRSLVHAGDPAPGGGAFRQVFHIVMNNKGEIVFIGDLTPPPGAQQDVGVFLYAGGQVVAIARPGDPMPGGGHLLAASLIGGNEHINNRGDVVFSALLDSDLDQDGTLDTGLFQWSHGRLALIARSGTVIPGVGTIFQLAATALIFPPPPFVTPTSGAINNDRGQVVFQATLTDDSVVLLEATPGG